MVRIERWKAYLITFICVLGVIYTAPNFYIGPGGDPDGVPSWVPSKTINLGLDLQGGAHLLLEVDTDSVLKEHFETTADSLKKSLRIAKIKTLNYTASGSQISFKVADLLQQDDVRELLISDFGTDIAFTNDNGAFKIRLSDQYIKERETYTLEQSIEIVRRRVDETGTREPVIQRQGTNRIVLQLPGIDDPERIKGLLGKTAKLTFHLVDVENTSKIFSDPNARIPVTSIKVPASSDERASTSQQSYVLKRRALITGDMLIDASPSFSEGRPVVSFRLDSRGAKIFGKTTTDNVGRPFAIVLDNEVISAPNIQSPILGGQAIITGTFTTQEVNDLSLLLRAGALPAPLKILQENTVGPGLGQDSIDAGKLACMVGFAAVILFIVMTYGFFGILASVALCMNLVLITAALSLFQATLTLPGIAGIVLTIGMAVDANVLIYERIREEYANGRPPVSAIDAGYSNAYSSIVDANLTTLIASILLFSFGSGPVKGFAVTLAIGIITSFFCAIMLTRLMVTTWLWKKKPDELKL